MPEAQTHGKAACLKGYFAEFQAAAPAPPDLLAQLLQECGALSERALLAASELDPAGFRAQLALEQGMGAIRATSEDEQVLLEAVG